MRPARERGRRNASKGPRVGPGAIGPAWTEVDDPLHGLAAYAREVLETDGAAVAVTRAAGVTVKGGVGLLEPLRGRSYPATVALEDELLFPAGVVHLEYGDGQEDHTPLSLFRAAAAAHLLAAPLRLAQDRTGILVVANRQGGHGFGPTEAKLLGLLAEQAAVALENRQLQREVDDLEQALTRSTAELAQAVQAKDEFFTRVSHEFRTPLNAVLCYGELLQDAIFGELNPKQRDAVERLQAAGRRLRALVENALDLNELKTTDPAFDTRPLELHALVDEVVASLHPEAERRGLCFAVEPRGPDVRVETDGAKVRRILLILCSNAIKFTERGTITVRVFPTEDGGCVEVADPGQGIPPDDLERIFGEFVQADEPQGGPGLGLSIARRLTARLGGRLTVESRPGRGSVFRLFLPAQVPASG